ncbi:ABC transporter permease [Conexibacter woesei]|uniref:Binding-protein-dependent transport systems inner membrane component n=1 Tax=Conexibacter woesei (strain DSM 14684 / CCUG 47730 / CIP 108061 / JCM 11494 / NBRC 100937 / ID131577) TaxID=469383 RepID=D3F7C0_CONWI|nr:ABC transporter permease [Conexibacter woesei]ADB48891.1 binding-protein-dependent transport systems inner membrane component [Conexibacter woesei DSM 14684]
MSATTAVAPRTAEPAGRGRRIVRRLRRLGLPERFGLAMLAAATLLALLGPLLAPHDPRRPVGEALISPGSEFLLGTDELGRDIFSRVLYGIQITWLSALVVVAAGLLVGGAIGLVAGVRGGRVDNVLMRIVDTGLALPGAVLAIAITVALGASLTTTVISIAAFWWPFYARLVRGEARAIAVLPHVEAARASGIGSVRLALKHVLPGALPPVIVAASLDLGIVVLVLAGLTFIGLGAQPPTPELGAMAALGLDFLFTHAWVPLAPAFAVFLLALSANLGGDGLRDLLEDEDV